MFVLAVGLAFDVVDLKRLVTHMYVYIFLHGDIDPTKEYKHNQPIVSGLGVNTRDRVLAAFGLCLLLLPLLK